MMGNVLVIWGEAQGERKRWGIPFEGESAGSLRVALNHAAMCMAQVGKRDPGVAFSMPCVALSGDGIQCDVLRPINEDEWAVIEEDCLVGLTISSDSSVAVEELPARPQ
jgi:hypothetical protein